MLDSLPDLGRIKALQARQERVKPSNEVETTLKAICCCAGRSLVEAFTVIAGLKRLTRADSADAFFTNHQHLMKCLVQVWKSLAYWEEHRRRGLRQQKDIAEAEALHDIAPYTK
jgi:hypothetical protein